MFTSFISSTSDKLSEFLLFFNSVSDLASISIVCGLLILSLVSLGFVLHLHLKSRKFHHLQSFNTLWTVRFLFIFFITLWALNEFLQIPFIRVAYLYPFLSFDSSIPRQKQVNLCKIHVVLSLGLFEPGFLVTLLFLLNVSIKKKTPRGSWALPFVSATCFPILCLQIVFLFCSSRLQGHLPEILWRSSWAIFEIEDASDVDETFLCHYPMMSCIIFAAFGIWYLIGFSLTYFKVVSLVINNGLRSQISGLAFAVMITLPLEVISHILASLWRPLEAKASLFNFLAVLSTIVLAAVGEGILVIRPIADSLAACGDVRVISVQQEAEEEGQRHGAEEDAMRTPV